MFVTRGNLVNFINKYAKALNNFLRIDRDLRFILLTQYFQTGVQITQIVNFFESFDLTWSNLIFQMGADFITF